MRVADRVAIVTGAGSGIGRATAIELARRGADLAVTDVSRDRLAGTVAAIEGLGRRATAHGFDVADLDAWKAFRGEVLQAHGGVHLLMNNAGVCLTGPFLGCSEDDLRWQLDVNLRGVMWGCHVLLPELVRQPEAHVVNVSSLFGLVAMPESSAYSMSKHAVKALSHSLMLELPPHVGVTSVHPGAVATRITADGRFREGGGVSQRGAHAIIAGGIPPEAAARQIVDAVEAGREDLLVGRDARLLAAAQRVAPGLTRRVLRRLRERRRQRYAGRGKG